MVWDLATVLPKDRPALTPPTVKEMDDLWAELAEKEFSKARPAMAKIVAGGNQSAKYLSERLAPKDPGKLGKWIDRLIQELDHEDVAVRDKATTTLADLRLFSRFALRQTLEKPPTVEVRLRAEHILKNNKKQTMSSESLRTLRGITVLETIGGKDAGQVLEILAKDLHLEEAQAALDRLAARSAKP